jgi:transcriptional regulator with XRE-family HTH domain
MATVATKKTEKSTRRETARREGDICVRLGERVRALRQSRGWGQADLVAESGLDRSFISKVENARQEIGLRSLEVLANSFGKSVSQFMRGV